ncbi:MAG: ribosomal protein large subunit ribosomal protein [Parcubacteria group bacterium]|jgi:large subunit ribosomal protein L21|nr:ribosomal protein large subunit ribosomal protein [Parcubacteria group bacterium]
MQYAVIKTGGKQYVVSPGVVVTIEKLGRGAQDTKKGDSIVFDEVLLTNDGSTTNMGAPFLTGTTVKGTVAVVGRNKKVEVVKYKAKSRYLKRRGHRQPHVKVKIDSIG